MSYCQSCADLEAKLAAATRDLADARDALRDMTALLRQEHVGEWKLNVRTRALISALASSSRPDGGR